MECLKSLHEYPLKTSQRSATSNATRSSVVGAGSNPAAALVLVAFLSVMMIINANLRRKAMMKMTDDTYSEESKAKRVLTKLTMNLAYIIETVWATGVSVAAAMVISAPINRCRA